VPTPGPPPRPATGAPPVAQQVASSSRRAAISSSSAVRSHFTLTVTQSVAKTHQTARREGCHSPRCRLRRGRDKPVALRVGAPVGPVYTGWDDVVEQESFFGTQLTRCARIEPIAFAGKVFVSEAFAADLALTSRAFICEYVGTIPTAKHFRRMPMYLLRRRR
jgi:hypothetical protein